MLGDVLIRQRWFLKADWTIRLVVQMVGEVLEAH